MPSQYGELRPTYCQDQLAGLRHPSKFQRGSHLGFATAAMSLNGSQPNFAGCLAICWAGILHGAPKKRGHLYFFKIAQSKINRF